MQNEIGLCYVYAHVDPITNVIMYIGHGQGARAYTFKSVQINGTYSHRNKEHSEYLEGLYEQCYLPHEWTEFLFRNLSKKTAAKLERELIELHKPIYNQTCAPKLRKLSDDQIKEAIKLRKEGWYYSKLAEHFGVAAMTIHRALSGKSKVYKDLLND